MLKKEEATLIRCTVIVWNTMQVQVITQSDEVITEDLIRIKRAGIVRSEESTGAVRGTNKWWRRRRRGNIKETPRIALLILTITTVTLLNGGGLRQRHVPNRSIRAS